MIPPPARVVRSTAAAGDYPLYVEAGRARALAPLLDDVAPRARLAVIADATVAALHAEAVRAGCARPSDLYTFPAGEPSKSVAEWARLTGALLTDGHDRASLVIALGGGVTGDLAGFVAATFMRGVPVVQVPTTLLAMIDSSVGGKTGVNTQAGKNLIGTFHAPCAVVIDPTLGATLPERERAQGLVEAVKHGAIRSAAHLARIERAAGALLTGDVEETAAVVRDSIAIKAEVVGQDEREAGLRRILNFGHTIGHALERLSDFGLPHGTAVAAGLVAEARLGEALGVSEAGTAERISAALAALGLDGEPLTRWSAEDIVAATRSDKKGSGGRARYVLLERAGVVAPGEGWLHAPEEETVVAVLRARG